LKRRFRFIINPISGGKNKTLIPERIRNLIQNENIDAEIIVSKNSDDTIYQAKDAVIKNFDAVIAVGGDGTINNIATQLINQKTALGIIPMGSGNGLSRALNIPFNLKKAIGKVLNGKIKKIDTGLINDIAFVNLAGVGFDAHVAGKFHSSVSRGLLNYVKITISEFNNYKPRTYNIVYDGVERKISAFLITVNNGTQFGNNAYTAPNALLDDGLLNVMIIHKCSWYNIPSLAIRLFTKTIAKHPNVESFSTKSISIKRAENELVNIDGEPFQMSTDLIISLNKLSLCIIQ
jgi:diacylglycerol kinase (ATP)